MITDFADKLNPFMKAITVLVSVILIAAVNSVSLNLAVFAGALLTLFLFSGCRKKAVLFVLLPALFVAAGMFMTGMRYGDAGNAAADSFIRFGSAWMLSSRIMAFPGLGIFLALTTPADDFVSSLIHQGHVPVKFAYGILAALHLVPDMKREYAKAQLAFRTRGMYAGTFSTKVLFTMLVNSIRWSGCMAMAMESKGFDGSEKRTYYKVTVVRWYDWACSIGLLAVIAGSQYLR